MVPGSRFLTILIVIPNQPFMTIRFMEKSPKIWQLSWGAVMLHLQKLKSYPNSESFLRNPLTGGQYLPGFGVPGNFFFQKILRILKPFAQKRATTLSTQRWSFKEKGFFENKACGMLIDLHEALTWTSTTSHCSSDKVFVCIWRNPQKTVGMVRFSPAPRLQNPIKDVLLSDRWWT